MNKRFLAAIALASSLSFASYDVIARGAPPAAAKEEKKADKPAAAPVPKVVKEDKPAAKVADLPKPSLKSGPAAKGAPPPLLKPAAPDSSGAAASPPSSGTPAAQGKPAFDNAAAQAQKAQDRKEVIKKAEDERLAKAQAKRESDAAIARAQASSRGAAPSAGQSVTDTERIRRLEESNSALRANNGDYRRRARAAEREADLRAQYHYGNPYAFRSSYSDIFVGSMIWSMWASWNAQQQAEWMYHHQSQMDQMRYQELLNSNAQLRSEVQNLERQSIARNSAYVPPQLAGNEDLMYAQNAAQIAQQQAAQAQAELAAIQSATTNVLATQTPTASLQPAASGGSHWLIWTTLVLVLIGGGAFFWLRREAK